jgi:hypothetical protein
VSNFDPFADEAQTQDAAVSQGDGPWDEKPDAVAAQVNNEVSLTFKGGPGHDAPWVVVRASTPTEALELVGGDPTGLDASGVLVELFKRVSRAGYTFSGMAPGGKASGNGGGQQQRPAGKPEGADQAPGGQKEFCAHGQMEFKSGVSRQGNAYKGFFCPSKDRDNQCKPKFIK